MASPSKIIDSVFNYVSNIGDKWYDDRAETQKQFEAGEITDWERGIRNVAGHVNLAFTPFSDAAGAALSATDETLFSGAVGEGLQDVGAYLSETDAGQAVAQYIQENPRAAENVMAAVDVAGVIPIARIVKEAANRPAAEVKTLLEGFYGPGVGKASKGFVGAKGFLESFPTSIKNTFNPKAIAYERTTGLPQGKIKDISETKQYDSKGNLTERPRGDRIGAAFTAESIAQQRGAKPGTTAIGEGPLGVADELAVVKANNTAEVSRQLFSKGVNIGYDVPDAVKNKHLRHIYNPKVWKFNKDNTDIKIKNPEGKTSGLGYEAKLGQSSAVPRTTALKALDQDKVTLASKKDSKDNVVAKGLSAWSKKDVAKLNKNDIKAYYSYLNGVLEKAGENKRYNLTDDNDGFLHISDSHGSREKELGGVNNIISINPETGDVFTTISDQHDMFGINPLGGKGLIAVSPTQRSNFKKHAEDAPLRKKVNNLEKQIKNIDNKITELNKELTPVPKTSEGNKVGKNTKKYKEWEKENKKLLTEIKNKESAKKRFKTQVNNTKNKYTVFDKTDNLNKEKIQKKTEEAANKFEKKYGIERKREYNKQGELISIEDPVTYHMRALGKIDPKANMKDYLTVGRRTGMLTGAAQSTLGAEQEEQNY